MNKEIEEQKIVSIKKHLKHKEEDWELVEFVPKLKKWKDRVIKSGETFYFMPTGELELREKNIKSSLLKEVNQIIDDWEYGYTNYITQMSTRINYDEGNLAKELSQEIRTKIEKL